MISRSESSGKVTLQKAEIDGGTALRFSGTNLIGGGGENTTITKVIKL